MPMTLREVLRSAAAAIFGAVAIFAVPLAANAALIEQDLNAPNDKLLTLDTATKLQWLDVNATLGLSYSQAEATSFVTNLGFRHATENEVLALYTSLGITVLDFVADAANHAGVVELIAKLGCTDAPVCGPSDLHHDALAASPSLAPLVTEFAVFPDSSTLAEAGQFIGGRSLDFHGNILGNYLVRTAPSAVTEPGSLLLLCASLIAFGLLRSRAT